MPPPKNPPRSSPAIAELFQRRHAIAEIERMALLVDDIEDLLRKFDRVAAELKTLGFCAPCYLSELDNGDYHDCVGED